MTKDRDGRHEGGSPVDTTRANTSPEELERADNPRQDEPKTAQPKDKTP